MTDPSRGWDRRFAEQGWPAEPDPLLTELVAPLPAGRALDIGSGPGRNSLWLAARGWQVTALDASAVALAQAHQRAATLGVQLATVQADARRWVSPPNSFDLIVIANLHPGADQLTGLLTRAAQALVPGGHLFVVGHDLSNLGHHGPPDPGRLLTVERLAGAMPTLVRVDRLTRVSRTPADPGAETPRDIAVLAWATRGEAMPSGSDGTTAKKR